MVKTVRFMLCMFVCFFPAIWSKPDIVYSVVGAPELHTIYMAEDGHLLTSLRSPPHPSLRVTSILLPLFCRFRASCEDGYVEGNGRPSCRITFVLLTPKA